MDRLPPPLLGFNNNVRHNGRLFHIQTEDSGIKYCRIVTHLFADGGRILQTCRTDYTPEIGRPDFTELIRQLMKDQHRMMFNSLRSGEFDEVIRSTFKGPTQAELEASDSPLSQRPQLRTQELPALTLRAPDESSTSAPPTEIPPSRPKRQSSRPPASKSGQRPGSVAAPSPSATPHLSNHTSQIMPAPKLAAALSTTGSNDGAARKPSKSIFGDSAASEQSLDDVILSYLEDDAGEGTSR